MHNPVIYFDERTGDQYVVTLDDDGEFSHALRYVDRVGRDAIPYERLADVPDSVRYQLESLITKP